MKSKYWRNSTKCWPRNARSSADRSRCWFISRNLLTADQQGKLRALRSGTGKS